MTTTMATNYVVLAEGEGLRLQSGPGRDLIFKVTGEDTGGAFDYFIVQVAPHGGPPLHVHHHQEAQQHQVVGPSEAQQRQDRAQLVLLGVGRPWTAAAL